MTSRNLPGKKWTKVAQVKWEEYFKKLADLGNRKQSSAVIVQAQIWEKQNMKLQR